MKAAFPASPASSGLDTRSSRALIKVPARHWRHNRLGKPLPVYGDGLHVRDWPHVEDHCVAITPALTHGRSGDVYNSGGNSETTNIEIVRHRAISWMRISPSDRI